MLNSKRAPSPNTGPKAKAWRSRAGEQGKVGLALLMWLLGVPGVVVLLYLVFGR